MRHTSKGAKGMKYSIVVVISPQSLRLGVTSQVYVDALMYHDIWDGFKPLPGFSRKNMNSQPMGRVHVLRSRIQLVFLDPEQILL